ncbi:39S ribosomal protein L21, mitochondrial [Cimex lectularius]|uniref:Large ribosomal subunit protein bL21m n=1 Tax=Cimex lectularius TaxID=79782 RepID=A0A8I6RLG7_CIMLE|nr:39S ribosomal protein L21, mitochondrial [Cimex lectularius]
MIPRILFRPLANLCNLVKCQPQLISRAARPLSSLPSSFSFPQKIDQVELPTKEEELAITRETIDKVNKHIENGEQGRLFAVVHICGKQFKVTDEDLIIIEGYWPPQNADEIKLEKVLLVGGLNFTLVGRPILPPDLVSVTATVIEKDLSHTKTFFYKRRRKQYMRTHFFRSQLTVLRIKEVSISGTINKTEDVVQYERI